MPVPINRRAQVSAAPASAPPPSPTGTTDRAALIDNALALWRAFRDPSQWWWSAKGNYSRKWEGDILIVLRSKKARGRWQWCIANANRIANANGLDARFSPDTYDTMEDARIGLGEALDLSLC